MFTSTFAIALAALLLHSPFICAFSLADGGFSNSLHLIHFGNVGDHPLDVRQLGQGPIPSQCDPVCNPVVGLLDNCTPTDCCTSTFVLGLFECFSCLQEALQSTNYSESQSAMDGFYNACTDLGYSLPILTFPGQDSNRSLSSLPSSGSSTSSVTRSSISISQTVVTGTTVVNPFATISQTAITTMPPPTSTTTSPTPPSSTPAPNSAVEKGSLRAWVQVTGSTLIWFLWI